MGKREVYPGDRRDEQRVEFQRGDGDGDGTDPACDGHAGDGWDTVFDEQREQL
jgi:hypothetical protein